MKDFLRIYGKAIWVFLKNFFGFLCRVIVLYVVIFLIWLFVIVELLKGEMAFIIILGLACFIFFGIIFFLYLIFEVNIVTIRSYRLMKKLEITIPEIMEAVFKFDLLDSEYKNIRIGTKYNFELWLDKKRSKDLKE